MVYFVFTIPGSITHTKKSDIKALIHFQIYSSLSYARQTLINLNTYA